MSWAFHLTPEERHLAKVGDLDALEKIVIAGGEEFEVSAGFERIFEALNHRPGSDRETCLDWGRRYVAWANTFPDRGGFPILHTDWARRMFEMATEARRPDLALSVVSTILCSYAPLERERPWWQKQQYHLTHDR